MGEYTYRIFQTESFAPEWQMLFWTCPACGVENMSISQDCPECGTGFTSDAEFLKDLPRKEVYSGVIEAEDPVKALGKLFEIFNVSYPPNYDGRSMSPGDIVILDGTKYICCGMGWKQVREKPPVAKIGKFDGEYSFLSNFYPLGTPIEHDGISYPTVEHAYQACKTESPAFRQAIAVLPTAAEAKRSGRNLSVREDWDAIKVTVMETLVVKKFLVNPDLQKRLLSTGDAVLEEGNHWKDTFWGVYNGVGENHLGKILMRTRARFASLRKAKDKFAAMHYGEKRP